jgi:iron(III) transport system ATP-binding protein
VRVLSVVLTQQVLAVVIPVRRPHHHMNVLADRDGRRFRQVPRLVGLEELRDRPASNLSGGQQQRVALARALVHSPRVVLFDEPLSNLDRILRDRMRSELQLLQSRLGFTALFVTHDQDEALGMSDRVLVMNHGVIEQTGPPEQVVEQPATLFAARFLGYWDLLSGSVERIASTGDGTTVVSVRADDGICLHATWRSGEPARTGVSVCLAFRPNRVSLVLDQPPGRNALSGVIESASFLGDRIAYSVRSGSREIRIDGDVGARIAPGQNVTVSFPCEYLHAFPVQVDAAP